MLVLRQCSASSLLVLRCRGLNPGPSTCEASTLSELHPQSKSVFEYSKTGILHLIILIFLAFISFWLLENNGNCWQFNQCSLLIPVSLSPSCCPHSLSPEFPFLALCSNTELGSQSQLPMFSFSRYLKLLDQLPGHLSIKLQPNSSSIWSNYLRKS